MQRSEEKIELGSPAGAASAGKRDAERLATAALIEAARIDAEALMLEHWKANEHTMSLPAPFRLEMSREVRLAAAFLEVRSAEPPIVDFDSDLDRARREGWAQGFQDHSTSVSEANKARSAESWRQLLSAYPVAAALLRTPAPVDDTTLPLRRPSSAEPPQPSKDTQ